VLDLGGHDIHEQMVNPSFWRQRTVFVTGHTGFKGGWIAHWLSDLGAKVHGYALEPDNEPNFFTQVKLQERLETTTTADIRDLDILTSSIKKIQPEIIIHMAAQPLVRYSYQSPVETFATNVMGTINLLEAARYSDSVKAIVNITTDKCYENREWPWPYRENDGLGGYDPYSASKACAEIASTAYRRSFLKNSKIHLASVRAGNVIGGGDWAKDRLIPDFLRAMEAGKTLKIRSPNSVRPWQHVLEPLSGYLILAEKLYTEGEAFAEAWNFGPNEEDAKTVSWLVGELCAKFSDATSEIDSTLQPHEAALLKLDSNKARTRLGWQPRWNLETALAKTIDWHRAWRNKGEMVEMTSLQIRQYQAEKKVP
jgi:CDP-glucose 4,6-dehydratase